MQNIPCWLTPAGLPAREQSHEQNSDFTNSINIFSGRQPKKSKNNFHPLGHCFCLVVPSYRALVKMLVSRGAF
jgi:hypothetical protein